MYRKCLIGATAVASLVLSSSAFAQQSKYGTAAEAKAMLGQAIEAVKVDKSKALDMFNKGEGGFKDRDLQPFCFNMADGKMVAATVASLIGVDARTLKDKTGKAFGEELFKTAAEGKIGEVSYMFPRPGESEPVAKVSFITRIGDVACGVGYHK